MVLSQSSGGYRTWNIQSSCAWITPGGLNSWIYSATRTNPWTPHPSAPPAALGLPGCPQIPFSASAASSCRAPLEFPPTQPGTAIPPPNGIRMSQWEEGKFPGIFKHSFGSHLWPKSCPGSHQPGLLPVLSLPSASNWNSPKINTKNPLKVFLLPGRQEGALGIPLELGERSQQISRFSCGAANPEFQVCSWRAAPGKASWKRGMHIPLRA